MRGPKFSVGDLLRPTFRALEGNMGLEGVELSDLMEVEKVDEGAHTEDSWWYFVRHKRTNQLWVIPESELVRAPILDALANL